MITSEKDTTIFASEVHKNPNSWQGVTLKDYLSEIEYLRGIFTDKTGYIPRMLDYGCGKAILHKNEAKHWNCSLYDPGYPPYRQMPEGLFDIVICTDVLEHVHPFDVGRTIYKIFDKAVNLNGVVFLSVCCRLAHEKRQFNGEETNAHFTVASPLWWTETVLQAYDVFNKNTKTELEIHLRFSGTENYEKQKLPNKGSIIKY